MLLSDRAILTRVFGETDDAKAIRVAPVLDWKKQLQAASLDVRLGNDLISFRRELEGERDVLSEESEAETRRHSRRVVVNLESGFVVHPGEFLLATTLESFLLPSDIAARLEGKSSWGRIGLQVHSTAGFVDPGFAGKITFEISNVGSLPVRLYPGLLVAQVCFFFLDSPSRGAYGRLRDSKYFGQLRTEGSRFYNDSEIQAFRAARLRPVEEGERDDS